MSKQSTQEDSASEKELDSNAPVSREDLLQYTENDSKGAEEFLDLLREFRKDRQRDRKSI